MVIKWSKKGVKCVISFNSVWNLYMNSETISEFTGNSAQKSAKMKRLHGKTLL